MKENKDYTALDALKAELPEKYGHAYLEALVKDHGGDVRAALQELRSTRQFDTGATRDTDEGKYDYEGFTSPLVERRFGQYMHKHRKQADGKLRDSDNWQKGIPPAQYIKSAKRHMLDWWLIHREYPNDAKEELEEALCGLLFNVQGYLHETIKKRRAQK